MFGRVMAKAAEGVTATALPSSPNTCRREQAASCGIETGNASIPRCGEAGRPGPTEKHSSRPVTAFRLTDGRFREIVRLGLL
jgi:hypothetical protein